MEDYDVDILVRNWPRARAAMKVLLLDYIENHGSFEVSLDEALATEDYTVTVKWDSDREVDVYTIRKAPAPELMEKIDGEDTSD